MPKKEKNKKYVSPQERETAQEAILYSPLYVGKDQGVYASEGERVAAHEQKLRESSLKDQEKNIDIKDTFAEREDTRETLLYEQEERTREKISELVAAKEPLPELKKTWRK